MKREFLTNLIFLVGINLLVKPVYLFGIERGVQNTLAPGEYGLWFAFFNFTFLFQIINDFGLRVFTNRQVAQNRHMVSLYMPNLLVLKLMLALVYLLTLGIFAWLLGYRLALFPLLGVVALNQILVSLSMYLRANIAGLGHYRFDSLLSAADKLFMIFILGAFIWGPSHIRQQFTLWHFVWAQTLSWSLVVLMALGFLLWKTGPLHFYWRWKRIRMLMLRSAPFALAIFLMTIYTRVDGVMVERLLPDGRIQADIYASAYRLLDASNNLGYLFAALLLPMFAGLLKAGQPVAPLVRFSIRLLWSAIFPLVAACIAYNREIMETLYLSGSPYSGKVLAVLMVTLVATSGNYVYSTLLSARGKMAPLNRIFAGTMLANVLLNLLLIPPYQALGAAIATCLTQMVSFFLQLRISIGVGGLRSDGRLVLRLCLLALLSAAAGWVWVTYWPASWFWGFLGSFSTGVLAAFALRLIDLRSFGQLLRQKLENS
jgi:O-antigen/teichoic acid export membrane protein